MREAARFHGAKLVSVEVVKMLVNVEWAWDSQSLLAQYSTRGTRVIEVFHLALHDLITHDV
jgi:hypothetical protein